MLRPAALLFSCVVLAACQTTNPPSDVVFPAGAAPAAVQAAPAAEPAPAPQAEAAKPAAPARASRSQPAGRAARAPDVPAEPASTDDGPMTVTKAREQCWMMSENDKAARGDLDKKVKFVEACVDKKMNASIGR
jgi:hypothetical protein